MKVEVAVLGTRFCGRKATVNNNNLTPWAAFASVYHPHVPCDPPTSVQLGSTTTTTTPTTTTATATTELATVARF